MQMNNVVVPALQETKLSQLCSLTAPGYNIVRNDRTCLFGMYIPSHKFAIYYTNLEKNMYY